MKVAVTAVKQHKINKYIKQMAEDALTNSNAKKYEQERSEERVDPESGLHLKAKEMTVDEDMERINPNFNTDNAFFKVNCTACTIAADLRQRGYDVAAGTDGESMLRLGGNSYATRASWFKDGGKEYVRRFLNNSIDFDGNSDSESRVRALETQVSKTPNSRGEISLQWIGGGGHSIFYTTDKNGKLTVYDPQSNKKHSSDSLKKLLANADEVKTIRLDDLDYNYDTLRKTNIVI